MPTNTPCTPLDPALPDPYQWLEDVEGDAALTWVKQRNASTMSTLGASEQFATTKSRLLEVLDSDDRIPDVVKRGEHLYNFWRDAAHPRGLWRRTTLNSYRTETPEWDVLLDLDALATTEGANWVWHGARVLRPAAGEPYRHVLIALSKGGSDADVTREFDLVERRFVDPTTEGGFHRPEAKGALSWVDADTVYAYSDFGAGSMTTSGYPRTVRLWRRGTALADAPTIYEGRADDMYIGAHRSHTPGFVRDFVQRTLAFYNSETYLVTDVGTPTQRLTKIDVPDSAEIGFHRQWLLIELRDAWDVAGVTYDAGSLLVAEFDAFMAGERRFTVLFSPTPTTSLVGATWTRHHLVLNVLDDVVNRLEVLTPSANGESTWGRSPFAATAPLTTITIGAVDAEESDDVWVNSSGYLTPTTLSLATVDAGNTAPEILKSAPAFFAAEGLVAGQHFATSADGTKVPYFVVGPADALGGNAPVPTAIFAYGGFEVSLLPGYDASAGRAWLERGGVYVVANLRGGGEYGPRWHQAALKANRHRAYEDLAAVARDLVARGITTHAQLGVHGRSNGGLLTGNMLVRYPDLFGAIVIGVPLLDMKRYSHLLAGASWMAEYGDPDDPAQWEFIKEFSPYHLIHDGQQYPPVLLYTSTRDDRVHPGHARKFTALLEAIGADVTYFENTEGGHAGSADNAQLAHMNTLYWEFLAQRLGL